MSLEVRPFNITAVAAPQAAPCWPAGFRDRPLDLEIGCGVGWHPIRYALENPERSLIAIEHTREKFARFQSRLAKHPQVENLLAVHADAVRWTSHHLEPGSMAQIFLLYPNPEPKSPNKRWLRSPFMHRLLEVLQPGGELILATNERAYFEEALLWAREAWRLKVVESRSFTLANLPVGLPRTHFEKKYLLKGETCFDVRWRKA